MNEIQEIQDRLIAQKNKIAPDGIMPVGCLESYGKFVGICVAINIVNDYIYNGGDCDE